VIINVLCQTIYFYLWLMNTTMGVRYAYSVDIPSYFFFLKYRPFSHSHSDFHVVGLNVLTCYFWSQPVFLNHFVIFDVYVPTRNLVHELSFFVFFFFLLHHYSPLLSSFLKLFDLIDNISTLPSFRWLWISAVNSKMLFESLLTLSCSPE